MTQLLNLMDTSVTIEETMSQNPVPQNNGHWHLVFSKPRQEWRAMDNLIEQGYAVYLPTLLVEKIQAGRKLESVEPLFPRYLFIQLDNIKSNWLPIRSTLGVTSLVRFGNDYGRVPEGIVTRLMHAEQIKKNLLEPSDAVKVTSGPFKGLEGIYQQADGIQRVLVLMQLFSKPQTISLPVTDIRRLAA